jgi:hypothetical protein
MSSSESDTSSLVTLPTSLTESLYTTKGQRRFAALNEDYASVSLSSAPIRKEEAPLTHCPYMDLTHPHSWPCDSAALRLELLIGAIYGKDMYPNGMWYEPLPGMLEESCKRRRRERAGRPVRIVDLGELDGLPQTSFRTD